MKGSGRSFGGTQTFIVRTIRHEGNDHVFIEMIIVAFKLMKEKE